MSFYNESDEEIVDDERVMEIIGNNGEKINWHNDDEQNYYNLNLCLRYLINNDQLKYFDFHILNEEEYDNYDNEM